MKKSAVDHYGANYLLALNDQKIQKFASGGLVGGGSAKPAKGADAKEFTLQIVNITEKDQIPNAGAQAQQVINVINADIAQRGPTFKAIKAAVQM